MPRWLLPERLEILWPALEEPDTTVYAGGTDVLVKLRAGSKSPRQLICLERIPELQGIEDRVDGVLIKAGTTHARIAADPLIQARFPILVQALNVLGSPPIRNMGTIGGNICSASPAGDSLPPLYVLEAEVELCSRTAARRLPIRDFIQGPGQTALGPGEILIGVWISKNQRFSRQYYEKVGQRKALAIAIVSLAALLDLDSEGLVADIRLAWGSVGPTVVTAPAVEAGLRGRPLTLAALQKAAAEARRAVAPIDDVRATAEYRREVAGNLLHRLSLLAENGRRP
ncbi:MAG: xanthine dehydrogenase family protein subunit M [Deltaproteobacteria bacterium]|nr:xanthine dehydrogenase family protein subunit M [Deltaproteobacteria bacterium]